jgi:hypothetical protein
MRKHIRLAAALMSAALLAAANTSAVFAAAVSGAADFGAGAGGDGWGYVGVTTYGDTNSLFDLFGGGTKNLAPGAVRTVNVQLRNRSGAEATFWLRAEALTGGGAKLLEGDFAGKTAVDGLLEKIDITVSYKGEPIYAGTLGGVGTGGLYSETGAALGTLGADSYGGITVTLRVSDALGNGYFNSLCAVNWTFTATRGDESPADSPGRSGPGYGPGSGYGSASVTNPGYGTAAASLDDGLLAEIGDGDVPLSEMPDDTDLVVIADPATPLALPQTGGLMTYATPAAIALAVLLALYAATYIRGRKPGRKAAASALN